MFDENPYARLALCLALLLNTVLPPEEFEEVEPGDSSSSPGVVYGPYYVHPGKPVVIGPVYKPPVAKPAPKTTPPAVQPVTPTPVPAPVPVPVVVVPKPVVTKAQLAIAYAYAQLGKPYVWGAAGPYAFDCSGLTMMSWLAAGVQIPRTSEDQWAELPHVSLSRVVPGDLIIYYSGASHVAMYLGNGMVIEAPKPGRVVHIISMYANPVLGAVRP